MISPFLFSTVLYCSLLFLLLVGSIKVALSRLFAEPKKPAPRKGVGWVGRLLVSQLQGIGALQERFGERAAVQHEISRSLAWSAGILSASGELALAEKFYEASERYLPRFSEFRMDCMRSLAIQRFMQGKMRDAMPCFADVAETKHVLRSIAGVPQNVRILGPSWFVALGHVAMIDFLLKKQQLGWEDPDTVFFSAQDLRFAPGQTLLRELQRLGVILANSNNPGTSFDRIAQRQDGDRQAAENASETTGRRLSHNVGTNRAVPVAFDPSGLVEPPPSWKWDHLGEKQRAALAEEFWETFFPDGLSLPYSHAAAKIQNEWEAQNRPPNFVRRADADAALGTLRQQLGIPTDAWYVCLHVRQSGFHNQWNSVWEQARDADIRSYELAIQEIVRQGGYVVRMGDPTMQALPPVEGAIDYAHSELKGEYADILLLSGARFFVGTNSGLSVVPGIYGIPCVLTNWVPLGLPNWFGNDLIIPKLLRGKESKALISLEEMLSTDLGYVQNPQNLPEGMEFVDNTPEELAGAVAQMVAELAGQSEQVRDPELEEAYFALATKCGSYRGSRIGTAFMREHASDLCFSKNEEAAPKVGITDALSVS